MGLEQAHYHSVQILPLPASSQPYMSHLCFLRGLSLTCPPKETIVGGQNHNAVGWLQQVWRDQHLSHPGGEEALPGPRAQTMLQFTIWWIAFGPWSKQGEKITREKLSLGQGPRVIAASSITPTVLCDLGKHHYSLNNLGSLLANALHVYGAGYNKTGSTKHILSLRDKQYKLFILGAWLNQLFQLSSETPGNPGIASQKQQSLIRGPFLPGVQLAWSKQKAKMLFVRHPTSCSHSFIQNLYRALHLHLIQGV